MLGAAALMRYLHTATLGVLGRPFDLNADLPHLGNVLSMMKADLSPGLSLLALLAPIAVILLLFGTVDLCLRPLARLLQNDPTARSVMMAAVAVLGLLYAGLTASQAGRSSLGDTDSEALALAAEWDPWVGRQREASSSEPEAGLFAKPNSVFAFEQLLTLRRADASTLTRLTTIESEFRGLTDQRGEYPDIVLIFLESYGATLIEDPQHYPYIEDRFEEMVLRLESAGVGFASAQAVSPTFGGGSWRAHATVMSGLRIDNEKIYDLLLSSDYPSLTHLLAEQGYRNVAVEPGIREAWPEADYFSFDQIYDAQTLDYRGKEIGWWKIPDQYSLYKLHQSELAGNRQPVFAKVSLILSHIPYVPIPPLVEDWSLFDSATAYSSALGSVGADDYRDLTELSIRYVAAFRYELSVLEHYLTTLNEDNTLIIVSGDHQPPKLATHDSQSWAVPMHVFSRRAELIEPWLDHGFSRTLVPERSGFGMEDFLPLFATIYDQPTFPRSTGSTNGEPTP